MPFDAPEVTPPSLGVSAEDASISSPDGQTKKKVDKATPVAPPPISVGATNMPLAEAGVELAKRVLWIVSGAILALLVYLLWMEVSIAGNVADAYKHVLN